MTEKVELISRVRVTDRSKDNGEGQDNDVQGHRLYLLEQWKSSLNLKYEFCCLVDDNSGRGVCYIDQSRYAAYNTNRETV